MITIQAEIQAPEPPEVETWREWSPQTTVTPPPSTQARSVYTRHLLLQEYVFRAIQTAVYEEMEDGRLFASLPGFMGVWADGASREETRLELARTVNGWVLLKAQDHDGSIPVIHGLDLNGSAAT